MGDKGKATKNFFAFGPFFKCFLILCFFFFLQGQNTQQANSAVAAIARSIFERQFKWLVSKCNETLVDPSMRR